MLTYGLTDLESRFTAAVRESTAAGVPVRWDDESICCRSCYVMDNPAEVYTLSQFGKIRFTEQGAVYVEEFEVECSCTEDEYDEDDNVIVEGETCDVCLGRVGNDVRTTAISSVYFYYGSTRSAEVFTAALARNGITVVWNGDPSVAIEVRFND